MNCCAGGHIGIAELAYRYGFSSESAFSRAFRLRFGASPSEVRAHARGNGDGEPVDIRSREDAAMIQAWLADIRQPAASAGARRAVMPDIGLPERRRCTGRIAILADRQSFAAN